MIDLSQQVYPLTENDYLSNEVDNGSLCHYDDNAKFAIHQWELMR